VRRSAERLTSAWPPRSIFVVRAALVVLALTALASPVRAEPWSPACAKAVRALTATVTLSGGSGQGRWAASDATWWLTTADGARVGLRVDSGAGSPQAVASFVRPASGGPLDPRVVAALSTCAEVVIAERRRHPWAWAPSLDAPRLPPPPEPAASEVSEASEATPVPEPPAPDVDLDAPLPVEPVELVAGPPVRIDAGAKGRHPLQTVWRRVAKLEDAWDTVVPGGLERVCPCFEVFFGQHFDPTLHPAQRAELRRAWGPAYDPEPPSPWVRHTNLSRNTSFVFGWRGADGTLTWVGRSYGPARVLGFARGRWWLVARAPMNDVELTIFTWTPNTRQLQGLTIFNTPYDAELRPAGLALVGSWPGEEPGPGTIPWAAIEARLRRPGVPASLAPERR
jgi:hypothetical protein